MANPPKPQPTFNAMYYDVARNSLVKILQVDRVTVQFRVVADESEEELTKDEVLQLIESKIWTSPPKAAITLPPQESAPKEMKDAAKAVLMKNATTIPSGEKLSVYISSIKALKEGRTATVSLEKQDGWAIADLYCKPHVVEVDLNSLSPEDVRKIMKILEAKGEANVQ